MIYIRQGQGQAGYAETRVQELTSQGNVDLVRGEGGEASGWCHQGISGCQLVDEARTRRAKVKEADALQKSHKELDGHTVRLSSQENRRAFLNSCELRGYHTFTMAKQGLPSGSYGTHSRGPSEMEFANHIQQASLPTGPLLLLNLKVISDNPSYSSPEPRQEDRQVGSPSELWKSLEERSPETAGHSTSVH